MKIFAQTSICFIILLFSSFSLAQTIKDPSCAGTFYPKDPDQLSMMIDGFFDSVEPGQVKGDIPVIFCPHAGYGFSGKTAAYAYKLIKGRVYNTVVIIGSSHFYGFGGISVFPEGVFRTPLGGLEIDSGFASLLLDKKKDIIFDENAFLNEHSIEVQLPFLQKALGSFKIVPVVAGDALYENYAQLAHSIKKAIGQRKDVLVVISCDLYHGFDYEKAEEADKDTISLIQDMDAKMIYTRLRQQDLEFKDGFPAITGLILAKDLGCDNVILLDHTNSSIVSGKKIKGEWTVGYASFAVTCLKPQENTGKAGKEDAQMLNKDQKKRLLSIARQSIAGFLKTGKNPHFSEDDPVLSREMGAFVTLTKGHELRGCIGSLSGKGPLYLTVSSMAIEAALRDPRFTPVEQAELDQIDLEISVLTPMKKVSSAEEIILGVHGVMVKKGAYSGVFLPQVATETGWTKDEFLSYLCTHKAGLDADAWKDKSTELYIFSAEVFSEKDNE